MVWVAVGVISTLILVAVGFLIGRSDNSPGAARPGTPSSTASAATTIPVTRSVASTSAPPTNTAATDMPATGSVSAPSTSGPITTAPTTTIAPATTLSPADQLSAIRHSWTTFAATLPAGTVASAELGTVGGQFIAASGSDNPFSVTVWTSKGGTWVDTATLTPTQTALGTGFVEVHTVDLTGDGNDEIFFNYYPGNDELGEVYQFTGLAWNLVGSDVALHLNGQRLTGTTNFCVPYCANGVNVPYNFVWNGTGFDEQTVDLSGNPIQIVETHGCPSGLRYNAFPPLKLCDKGPLVKALQAALNAGGLLYSSGQNGPLVDGAFGPDTSTSIRLYQFANGLQVNGVADGQWYYDLIENYNLSSGHG